MELGFVTQAMRRYWWLIAICVVLGVGASTTVDAGEGSTYESTALILISDPSEAAGQTDDRYIAGELVSLGSTSLAQAVATEVGGDIDADRVQQAVTFAQLPGTDIVRITAEHPSPDAAEAISNGYIDSYLEAVRRQLSEAQAPELGVFDDALATITAELSDVDVQIEQVLEPYIPDGPVSVDEQQAIPMLDQIDPALATNRAVLIEQYSQVLETRNALRFGAERTVTSRVVQRASLPDEPTVPPPPLVRFAAPVGGLVVGILAAVALARISPRVLDATEAGEILGVPLAATVPRDSGLSHRRGVDLERRIPPSVVPTIREICVQAEASKPSGAALTVVVTGAERHAGTTTVAEAMAKWFADSGSDVLLIDADVRNPELTARFASGTAGIPGLIELDGSSSAPRASGVSGDGTTVFVETMWNGLQIVGLGDSSGDAAFRRQNVDAVVAAASRHAAIVVYDAGPLMESVTAVQLAQLADAVVLTLPLRRQHKRSLQVVARQLGAWRGVVLPVGTAASKRSRRGGDDTPPGVGTTLDDQPLVSPAPAGKS